ncbi:hypothetical protein ACLMJK_002624 [Lecanora helva]
MTSPPPTPPESLGSDNDDDVVVVGRFHDMGFGTEWVESYRPGGFHPVHFGDVFKDSRYKIIRKLGYGSFSTVWLARDQTETTINRYVAVKILTAKDSFGENERVLYDRLSRNNTDHPGRDYVVRLLDSFTHTGPNGNHLCLVFEPMGPTATSLLYYHPSSYGGPRMLHDDFSDDEDPPTSNQSKIQQYNDAVSDPAERNRFPLWMARRILHQLLLAIDYLHQNGITHSDTHPGNILMPIKDLSSIPEAQLSQAKNLKTHQSVNRKDGKIDLWAPRYIAVNRPLEPYLDLNPSFEIKVSDLGGAFDFDTPPEEYTTPAGLRSPENICCGEVGPAQDIWSLGCLIFELITGEKLFTIAPFGGGLDEDDDDDHYIQLMEILGPLPSFIREEWSRASTYCGPGGEIVKHFIGEPVENMEIHVTPPLETYFDRLRPAAMNDEEADLVKDLLRSILVYNAEARPQTSKILQHPWFVNIGKSHNVKNMNQFQGEL